VDLRFGPEEEAFRKEVRDWLETHLTGDFARLCGRGGPGDEEVDLGGAMELRLSWERLLGAAGFLCLDWPKEYGGRELPLGLQVVFSEEYARKRAPARLGVIGESLLGPTLLAFGTEAQKRRFLLPIARGEALWCQGYSEPDAGSDLANIKTRAELRDGAWVITGHKIWTSLAHFAKWCFVLCRTDPAAPKHKGLSYLLVPMQQPGITVRPIRQLTGTAEFNEVFFDGARTAADCAVGEVNGGWRVALHTLAAERGIGTLGRQIGFASELERVIALAQQNGAIRDPLLRQRLVRSLCGLRIMRWNALRSLSRGLSAEPGPEASIIKLYWSTWHKELGELGMDVLGKAGQLAASPHDEAGLLVRLFLFSRADTIYAGSSEIQRNVIAERALGLLPEPRPTKRSAAP